MNEMYENNEVMDVVEETATNSTNLGGVLLGAAVIGGLAFGGYKLVKKLIDKKKNSYGSYNVDNEEEYVEVVDED